MSHEYTTFSRQHLSASCRVLESQAIIVDLIENFKFALPEDKPEILRAPLGLMCPIVKGKLKDGSQMPLHVTVV